MYATEPAPGTIEGMLNFARSSLGLMIPAADLIYQNNFKLLMQDVTLATVIGKAADQRGQMRSSALQPSGCRFSGVDRR